MENEQVEKLDMDQTILEAYKNLSSQEEAQEEVTEEIQEPKIDKSRDEKGRFAKIEEKPVDEPVEETPAPVATDALSKPPSSWKPQAKAIWANLPQEAKEEAHRRENEYFKGHDQLRPDADFGKIVKGIIEPYRMMIEAEGGTPETAINELFRTAAIFRFGNAQQKQQALLQIAQSYNVPLQFDQQQTQVNPELQQVYSRLNELTQNLQQKESQQYQQTMTSYTDSANRWMNEADAQGNPLRPFVDNVLEEMKAKIPTLKSQNPTWPVEKVFQEAYDRAVWEHPDTRATLLARQQAEAEATRREENLRKVTEAKKAAAVNVPARGFVPAKGPVGTMDQTILDTYRKLTG